MIIKCKMCGGDLRPNENATTCECEYCGSMQTIPKIDTDRRANLYDRANHFRRNNEYDKAMAIFEQILQDDRTDAEAYWSLVLCRYGIEYVEDPATKKRIPTVNRTQLTSIFADEDYQSALSYADTLQRIIYEEEAKSIDAIQKGILDISRKEKPFDVFICYKETDANGRRTPDSVLANDLYHQLTREGFKVFFSRITLEDKLGQQYEPYIFAALNSAKVMVVLGTKPEYFNAAWVKNEWSRYLALIRAGAKKTLVPAYKDMDPYDLPQEFSHLQAQDMSKLGFMQDLIHGIKKLASAEKPAAAPQPAASQHAAGANGSNVAALLDRASMALEDGEWAKADDFCEKVLNIDARNARAYTGKLMAQLRVNTEAGLSGVKEPLETNGNYQKALRFADDKLKAALTGYNETIKTRNERERLQGLYNDAMAALQKADTVEKVNAVRPRFEQLMGFKDAEKGLKACGEKIESINNARYEAACRLMEQGYYSGAAAAFAALGNYLDARQMAYRCEEQDKRMAAEAAEKKAVEKRLAAERAAREEAARREQEAIRAAKTRRLIIIAAVLAAVCIGAFFLVTKVIIPNKNYNAAAALRDAGQYEEAITAFTALNGYKDAEEQITVCETAIKDNKYNAASALRDAGQYEEAISAFTALNGYKDSAEQITVCEKAIKDNKYSAAAALRDAGKYEEAIAAFTALNGYKDATEQIIEIGYQYAKVLVEAGKYEDAMAVFKALNGYKDSKEQITKCETAIKDNKYSAAAALRDAGKYEEAIAAFTAMNGYKDAAEQITETKYQQAKALLEAGKYEVSYALFSTIMGYKDVDNLITTDENLSAVYIAQYEVGKMVTFGSYAEEPIEWLVLEANGDERVMISVKGLEAVQFNKSKSDGNEWSTSYVRSWLNGTFYNEAFSAEEKEKLINGVTGDKVYLLSVEEANKYFANDKARMCAPTAHAVKNGAYQSSDYTVNGTGACWWWLRSPGDYSNDAACVDPVGNVYTSGSSVLSDRGCVRPVVVSRLL